MKIILKNNQQEIFTRPCDFDERAECVADEDARGLPLVTTNVKPTLADGEFLVHHYVAFDDRIEKTFEAWTNAEDPRLRLPRRFSILALETALLSRGLLVAFDALLDTPISGTPFTIRRFYERANELNEAHPMFAAYAPQVKAALGVTDEVYEAILAEAEIKE